MQNFKLNLIKKIIIIFAVFALTTSMYTQETEKNYNRWSIELGAGLNKPSRGFTTGYYSSLTNSVQGNVGIRYMLNEKFGIRASGGVYDVKIDPDGNSRIFETQYY